MWAVQHLRNVCVYLYAEIQAVEQLLEVETRRKEGAYGPDTLAIGVARLQVRLEERGTDNKQTVGFTLVIGYKRGATWYQTRNFTKSITGRSTGIGLAAGRA